jgi:EAL domain-containing protein (putative c-di-GMP-specific phosphodiesterase class I)
MLSTSPTSVGTSDPSHPTSWLQCAYQPIWTYEGGLVRYEALLRPNGGSPSAVLAHYRAGWARTALTLAVLERVLADQQVLDAPVALNLDASDVEVVAELIALWSTTGRLGPHILALEVTEHARPTVEGFAALRWLSDLGYAIAFDDVGSGVWTAEDLARVPNAEVKLVPSLWSDPVRVVEWSACLEDRVIVAEGVEDLDELPGWVDAWQGYAGGAPAPPSCWVEQ